MARLQKYLLSAPKKPVYPMAVINFLCIDFNIHLLLKETKETDAYALTRAYLTKNAP